MLFENSKIPGISSPFLTKHLEKSTFSSGNHFLGASASFSADPNSSITASDVPSIMALSGSGMEQILKRGTAADQYLGKVAGYTTKALGVVGTVLTAVDIYSKRGGLHNVTPGDVTKVVLQGMTLIPGWGELYGAADIGFAIITGRSLTNRIGDAVDNSYKFSWQ